MTYRLDTAIAGAPDAPPTPACRDSSGHPLEFIPFFRRFSRSILRDVLYTFIWNELFAVFFVMVALVFDPGATVLSTMLQYSLIANCIGYFIHFGFRFANRYFGAWVARQDFLSRSLYYSGVSVVGVFAGYWLSFTLLNWQVARQYMFQTPRGALSVLLLSLIISTVLAVVFVTRERQARAEADFQRERARSEAAEKQIRIAQLRLLEAQLEPHFLYNTLANVISLIDGKPETAKRMIERLIDYMRLQVPGGTDSGAESTLARQVDLLRAYLDLIVLRMGSRLSYRIDIPDELGHLELPPMFLQPLVENAIKHGLEPKVEGGMVRVSARRAGEDGLELEVADDGLGFRERRTPGPGGLGLANLRERLQTLYGDRARIVIEDAVPSGTRITLRLPLERR